MVKRGGIGKHLWDVTYEEYNWYQKVIIPPPYLLPVCAYVFLQLLTRSIALFRLPQ